MGGVLLKNKHNAIKLTVINTTKNHKFSYNELQTNININFSKINKSKKI